MKIVAVPVLSESFCPHFGGASQFVLYRVDPEHQTISEAQTLNAPPHKPGALPLWLSQQGVTAVLAGRMGDRAKTLLTRLGIDVVSGVSGSDPADLVMAYLDASLEHGDGRCDGHGRLHQCGGGKGVGTR